MRTRRLLVAIAAAAFALAGVVGPAAADTTTSVSPGSEQDEVIGGIGVRLAEAPVSGADDPRARVYIVDHLAPASVITRRIEVSNTTASSQHVVLYAAAATIEGGSFVGAAADTANALSSWTSVSPAGSDVAANGTLEATVTIAVPADVPSGEQYGVVWAEARSRSASGGGVVQVSRVGIRLYVSIGAGGPPAADFTINSLTAGRSPEGLPTVDAIVRNTGGRALDLNGTMQLDDGPGGLSAGPFPAEVGRTLALGDTESVSVVLDNSLPAGPWHASMTLSSGLTTRTVEATITFPDSGLAAPVPAELSDSDRPWVLPAIGAGTLVFVIAAIVVALLDVAAGGLPVERPAQHEPRSPVRAP